MAIQTFIDKKLDSKTLKDCRGLIEKEDKLEYCPNELITEKEKKDKYCTKCRKRFFIQRNYNPVGLEEHKKFNDYTFKRKPTAEELKNEY